MNTHVSDTARTRALLLQHFHNYPKMQIEDIFKHLYHSAFGCDHLVSDEAAALRYIQAEYAAASDTAAENTEPLDGNYSRVHLGVLRAGLRPETLARLFFLSARKEPDGKTDLEQKLDVASKMVKDGSLPVNAENFARKLHQWRTAGFPAIHHSAAFREAYAPAYRVIANEYVAILPILTEIDKRLADGSTVVAVEGGSASGKTTLAHVLQQIYGCEACNVFHTDDFFLQPAQRTPARLAEAGGNLDRERFADEIVHPLCQGSPVTYRRFDCTVQTLGEPITVPHAALTVIEGTYSLHPAFGQYYHLAVFLDVDPVTQAQRITKRNSPGLAKRFFDEWIPLEQVYFSQTNVKSRADLILRVQE